MNILEQNNTATSQNKKFCLIFWELLHLNTQLNSYKIHKIIQLRRSKTWSLATFHMPGEFKDLIQNWFIIDLKVWTLFHWKSWFRYFGMSSMKRHLVQISINFEVDYSLKLLENFLKVVKVCWSTQELKHFLMSEMSTTLKRPTKYSL